MQNETVDIRKLPIKNYVIIGSSALGNRYAKDIDVICMEKDIECEYIRRDDYAAFFRHNGKQVECLLADKQESLVNIYNNYFSSNSSNGWNIASPIQLFALKKGHIIFPNKNWEKHIADYHYLKGFVNQYNAHDYVEKLSKLHRECTKERLKVRGTPKLIGVSKEDFFDDKVVKYYIHDDIHKAMAHTPGKPMYENMQKDLNSVECSKELWDKFPRENKIMCVLEEAYTIALERHIIPTMKTGSITLLEFDAFKWALMRICTNLCSGWFRQYAIDNYFTILNSYNSNYVKVFLANIDKYITKLIEDEDNSIN